MSRRERRARRTSPDGAAALPWFRLPASGADEDRVLVVGGGLAGCSLARALAARGRGSLLIERGAAPGAGASGNPAGLAKPYVTRAPTAASAFLSAAHAHLMTLLATDGLGAAAGFRALGSLQLIEKDWAPAAGYRVLDAEAASREAGTRVPAGALAFDTGGWLDPGALCRALLAAAGASVELVTEGDIVTMTRSPGAAPGWTLEARDGRRWHGSELVLATGTALASTPWTRELPIEPARGQISRFALAAGTRPPARIVAGRRYAIPDGDTLYVGATFEAGVADPDVRDADDAANRKALEAVLPDVALRPELLSRHAGVRATTPDRLPMAGPVPDLPACRDAYAQIAELGARRTADSFAPQPTIAGLSMLGGFGARGIVAAPFAAELLADWLCGGENLQPWAPSLLPVRFATRALRRHRTP